MAILSSQHLYEIKKMYAEVHKSLEGESREKIEGLNRFWTKLEPYLYEETKKQIALRKTIKASSKNEIDWSCLIKLGLLGCAVFILSFLIFVSAARNADAFSCWMPGMDFSDGRIKPVGEIPSGAEGSCSAEGVSNLDEAETECYNAADSAYLVREQNCYFRPDLLKAGVVARHGNGTLSRWCSVPIACRYPSWHEKTGATTGESADWRLKQDYHKLTWCLDGSHSQKGDCIAMPVTESEWANNVGVAILQTALKAKSAYTHKAHVYRWDNFLDLMVARKRSEARSYARQWADRGWAPWVKVHGLLEGY